MQLRYRLSLYIVAVFSIVILLSSAVTYLAFFTWLEDTKINSLENKTLLAAIYYLEEDEISHYEHESIKSKLQKAISKKDIALYNTDYKVVRGEMKNDTLITVKFLNQIRENKKGFYTTGDLFYYGIFYEDNEGDFIVVVKESKSKFNQQLNTLLVILLCVCVGGILIVYLLSIKIGKFAYVPIINIMKQIKERDSKNFHTPIKITESYAEINNLVETYNQFIDQLSHMFQVQKDFVDYVSHELKTPITSLLGTVEVILPQVNTEEEKQDAIEKIKANILDLEQTIDNMMLISGVKTNIEFKPVRFDEVIWSIVENHALIKPSNLNVEIKVDQSKYLNIHANRKLLELAVGNIIENALKYSDYQKVSILLTFLDQHLIVRIIDSGIGIAEDDLDHITNRFYRGKNTNGYQGKGIGLSLSKIIFKLHGITMNITSSTGGTTVELIFPALQND